MEAFAKLLLELGTLGIKSLIELIKKRKEKRKNKGKFTPNLGSK